mmetsp:Transcript_34542/g.111241  ORF Transcript_34542/g.111241 Transcript_34542/m.111241 type:complete len:262 (+) Transcript_34542:188-973(+)
MARVADGDKSASNSPAAEAEGGETAVGGGLARAVLSPASHVRREVLGGHVLAHLCGGRLGGGQHHDPLLVLRRQEGRDDRPGPKDGAGARQSSCGRRVAAAGKDGPHRAKQARYVDDEDLLNHRGEEAAARLLHRGEVLVEDGSRPGPEREEAGRAGEVVHHRPEANLAVTLRVPLALQPAPLRHVQHVPREVGRRDERRLPPIRVALAVAELIAADHGQRAGLGRCGRRGRRRLERCRRKDGYYGHDVTVVRKILNGKLL